METVNTNLQTTKKRRKKAAGAKAVEAAVTAAVKKAKKQKPLSNLARKKADERYFLNGKGRYVSKKKSQNGKANVQSRAIRLARKVLGIKGMVLLGKGDVGKKLLETTSAIRQMLKDGKTDEEAEALHAGASAHVKQEEA